MDPYSHELGRHDFNNTTGTVTLATVPAGEVWVIKDASVVGLNTGSVGVRLDRYDGTLVTPFWCSALVTNNQESHTQERQIVLVEGDALRASSFGNTGTHRAFVRVGGYKLTAAS